jgi:hypothetical protein
MTGFVIFVVVMIVVGLINKARQQATRGNGQPNARMQALIERIQAQQGGNQPVQFQGQFTQAAGPGGPPPAPNPTFPVQSGDPQGSQQAAAALQQLMQSGRQAPRPGEWATPAQPQYPLQYNPTPYQAGPYQPPAHRPQQSNLPTAKQDLDARVRELMSAGNEVGAIRLLSDERDLGILEAQKYARELVAPPTAPRQDATAFDEPGGADEDEARYVGSAAFAESIFNLDDREENVWASGWVDKPDPDDRSDIDELWQTVSNPPGRPRQS